MGVFVASFWQGVAAGAVGVTAMTAVEKLEQCLTGRPFSYVPARILENAAGVGAPPWTWPRDVLAVDFADKPVDAFATGAAADLLAPTSRHDRAGG